MSVNSKMTAIADAIRAKTGGTSVLTLDQMATEIGNIGGVDLPTLTNEGTASDLMKGKQLISGSGAVVSGSFTLDTELSEQDSLIEQLRAALQGKMAGGEAAENIDGIPAGYARCDYIQFTRNQTIDTGIICNQNTRIQTAFTRERNDSHYLYGVASSDNTASVTTYLGGSWRFGNKYVSKSITTIREDISYSVTVDKTEISTAGSVSAISGVTDFETVGTLLLGACRNSNGTVAISQFEGKVFYFAMWESDEQVLKLVPVVSADGVYRFFDMVSKTFFDSITDTPLGGGNI